MLHWILAGTYPTAAEYLSQISPDVAEMLKNATIETNMDTARAMKGIFGLTDDELAAMNHLPVEVVRLL